VSTPSSISVTTPQRTLRQRLGEPNPIWMREMRQGLRLGRTPWILLALTLTVSLFLCSIGGIATSDHVSPAHVGGGLFQAFFSIAYMVVVVVGPAVAANGIAAEREGRTWEAVLLAGLDARSITRGKFLAAYTTIALYIVTLAPVGALSFLFGGVTATEVVTAFVFLFLLAGLAVAFGLAVSSLMESLRGALVTTLALAVMLGPLLYLILGVAGAQVIHNEWPDVDREVPIWLPLALTRAEFGLRYVMLLVFVPVVLVLVPARFLYAVTVANLTGDTDDQSTGLKRWYLFSTPAVVALAIVPPVLAESHRGDVSILSLCVLFVFTLFAALLFAREPLGPSRRVRVQWERSRAGRIARFMGPGLPKTMTLVLLVSIASVVFVAIVAAMLMANDASADIRILHLFFLTSYAAAFLVFVTGGVAILRARGSTPWVVRIVVCGVVFLVSTAPWVAAAIVGALSPSGEREWLMIAAPSPFYAFYMIDQVRPHTSGTWTFPPDWVRIWVGFASEAFWAVSGLILLWRASVRCEASIATHELAVARADEALAREDAAAEAIDTSGEATTEALPAP
jgi:hypothetical protein